MSQRTNTRRSARLVRRQPTTPAARPMSGAGYDIEKEQKESELRWAKLEHAVNLALNYFKLRPVPSDQADLVRAFVLERAKNNFARVGGEPDDYMVTLQVNAIPHQELGVCVQPEPTVVVPSSVPTDTLEQLFFEPSPTGGSATGAAAGGGSMSR